MILISDLDQFFEKCAHLFPFLVLDVQGLGVSPGILFAAHLAAVPRIFYLLISTVVVIQLAPLDMLVVGLLAVKVLAAGVAQPGVAIQQH